MRGGCEVLQACLCELLLHIPTDPEEGNKSKGKNASKSYI